MSLSLHVLQDEVQAELWLSRVTRILGVSFLVFFSGAIVLIAFQLDHWVLAQPGGDVLMRLVRWGNLYGGSEPYELMISAIYVVWGIFLWRAAEAPFQHRMFLDFTLVGNAAHFGTMFVESFTFHGECGHLAGDVPLGWIGLVVFAIVWIPVRRRFVKV